jgi:3-(methylthio)propanoyl-CoA dehydrogenase
MYRAPLKDLGFVLHRLLDDGQLSKCAQFADYSADLGDTILQEAGKFAENVLEPLCKSGDREGAKWAA